MEQRQLSGKMADHTKVWIQGYVWQASFLGKCFCDSFVRTEKTVYAGTAQPPPEKESIPEYSPTFRLPSKGSQNKKPWTRSCMIYIYLPDSVAALSPSVKEHEISKVSLKMYKKVSLHNWNVLLWLSLWGYPPPSLKKVWLILALWYF